MAVHDSERVVAATLAVCLGLLGCSSSPNKSSNAGKDGGSSQGSGQANGGGTGGGGTATGRAGKGGSGSGGTGSKDAGAGTNKDGGTAASKDGGAGSSKDGSTSKDGATGACQKTGADDNCDGVDDDCDGKIDESYTASGTNCGVGACAATGATSCANGKVVDSCAPGEKLAQTDATCDGVDDDCDGTIDDDYVVDASCGVGACKANDTPSSCTNGIETQCRAGTAASNDSTCDGVDDDCDGTKDEDYLSISTTCGTGPCAATGSTSCVNGTPVDSCTQGAKLAQTDTTCDGIDDDCDGSNDEEYAAVGTTCGVGACAASGTISCTNGQPIDSCTPGAKLAQTDTTCDGIDDDCDGSKDEEYLSIGTTCGVGACAASGTTSCANGHPIDNCTPGSKLAQTDTTCNGIDEDCDGNSDEEYAAIGTTCGVGACAASGTTSCSSGHVVDGCAPGNKLAQTDTTCNGIDDDCDGSNDEEYVSNASCGTGVCRTGNTPSSCSGGIETACAPGAALSSTDTTCDGIDDNCSGSADEGYVSLPTTCGVGACSASGSTSCSGGHVANSCVPGQAASSDPTCNGVDDDCDGKFDENYIGCFNASTVGGCVGGQVTGTFSCSDGFSCTADTCVPATGDCNFAPSNAMCASDGYSCTKEFCVANADPSTNQTTGCTQVRIDAECPDATFCNGSEVCDPGNSGQAPSPTATGCAPAPLANRPCDPNSDIDSVPCTDTICIEDGLGTDGKAKGHCASTPDPTFCTDVDGQYCNGVETCAPGAGANADGCVAGVHPCAAVPACAVSICNNTGTNTGTCGVDYKQGYSCGDLDPCTTDACDLAANPATNPTGCTHVLRGGCVGCTVAADCTDPYNCTVDTCLGNNTCAHDASACQCFTNADCNDGKACTVDTCNSNGQCVHAKDDPYCVSQDLGQGGLCNGADTCDPSNNAANAQGCVHASTPLNCNDGLTCTVDSCDPALGCQHELDDTYCAVNDAVKCDGTAFCDASANPNTTPSGCTSPAGFVPCVDDGIACTTTVCVEVASTGPGVPSTFRCAVKPNDDYCIAQPGGCGSTCQVGVGCVKACKIATCQGKTYQCGDCIDNDGDCRIDTGADPDCLGPCSNNEAGFHGDIAGQNNAPCKMDCYFDQDTGAGNDDCYWSHSCDPLEVAPNYPPEDSKCAYSANTNIPGTSKTCAQLMATNPPGQSTTCWEAGATPIGSGGPNYCGNLVPNGCDCFGCCAVQGVGYPVFLGSEDGSGNGSCSLTTLTDKTKCKPCTQVPSCLNTCQHCELCVGKTTLPDDCLCQLCPAGAQLCGDPCGTPCPAGYFCNTGCCALVPQ